MTSDGAAEQRPHFDPDQQHGQVFGMPGVKWEQGGHYYAEDHTLVDLSSIDRGEQASDESPDTTGTHPEVFGPVDIFRDGVRWRIAQSREKREEEPRGPQMHDRFVDGGKPDAHGRVWSCDPRPSVQAPDDDLLADAVAMLAADVREERDRDARQPDRERTPEEWERLCASIRYLHREMHRAVTRGDISSEPVQRWAAMQRLFESQPFRALRNWPEELAKLRDDSAAKPRTMVDLWLWWHLPEPPELGKRINTKALLRYLAAKLEDEDWSKAPWFLTGAEADEFRAQIARHLKVTRQRFETRLERMGWYQPAPRP